MSERIPDEVLERIGAYPGAGGWKTADGCSFVADPASVAKGLLAERAWRREAEGVLGCIVREWDGPPSVRSYPDLIDRARALLGGSDDA